MNKTELKNILIQQAASYDEDLQNKIHALNTGENFLTDVSIYNTLQQNMHYTPSHEDSWDTIFDTPHQSDIQPQTPKKIIRKVSPSSNNNQNNKNDIKKRIARLRGLSLPGEYLLKKPY